MLLPWVPNERWQNLGRSEPCQTERTLAETTKGEEHMNGIPWAGNTEPPLLSCKAAQAATRMKRGVQRQDEAPVWLSEQQQWQSWFLWSWSCEKLEGSQVPGKDRCTSQDLRKSTERNLWLQIHLTDRAWKQGHYSEKDVEMKKQLRISMWIDMTYTWTRHKDKPQELDQSCSNISVITVMFKYFSNHLLFDFAKAFDSWLAMAENAWKGFSITLRQAMV